MKRLVSAAVIVLGYTSVLWAAPVPLNTVKAVSSLTNEEAHKRLPVAFQGTVTYSRGFQTNLFVQDGNDAIYVKVGNGITFTPGDRVLVKGTTESSFHPIVLSSDITLIGHGALPRPVPAKYDQLIRGQQDSRFVTMRGVIRSADLEMTPAVHGRSVTLRILTDGGYVDAYMDSNDATAVNGLLDDEVEITGVAGGRFDGKLQQTGVLLHISSLANIKVLKQAHDNPWSLPITPMNEILHAYHVENITQRVRVHGTITYYEPGSAMVLQNGTSSLWIKTQSFAPMRIGNLADATGFPGVSEGFLVLTGSEIHDDQVQAPITPEPLDWHQLASSKHIFDLVSIEGKVVTKVQEASQDEYVLMSDGYLFSAIYRHARVVGAVQTMPQIPVGSSIRVSGICILENANPFDGNVPFNILLHSPDDITVLAEPSWWSNVAHLSYLVGLLLMIITGVGVREWFVERKVRRRIGVLAYVEQRRGRILEDINNSRPLKEILERVTELVSVKLHGAACWCRVEGQATIGNCPPDLTASSLRVAERAITSRSGPSHGAVYAAFDSYTKPDAEETEALSMGAGLATLAIETSHLYSDLVHRSEFDLLTGVHNRFSLDKALDGLIKTAQKTAGIFGLIYIDLNDFKQVNDVYGHRIGDLYLQEATARMKRQLRPGDTLGRVGGDEFVVLVPVVRSHSDVEEIAFRLERCFEEQFPLQGTVINGSASIGIALYPAEANTKESLLSAADANMYVAKETRRKLRQMVDSEDGPGLSPGRHR